MNVTYVDYTYVINSIFYASKCESLIEPFDIYVGETGEYDILYTNTLVPEADIYGKDKQFPIKYHPATLWLQWRKRLSFRHE